MRASILFKFCAMALMAFSCMGEFPVNLSFGEPTLVVDALISSKSDESYINLGWTFPIGETCLDAHGYPAFCPPDDSGSGSHEVTGTVTIEEGSGTLHTYPIQMRNRKSYIKIQMPDITGVPGETYSLTIDIEYNGTTARYTSETRMRDTPTIDQTDYEIRQSSEEKDIFVPLISFREPQHEKNFYLFRLCEVTEFPSPSGGPLYRQVSCGSLVSIWGYSILSDEFLPENVINLSIDDGASILPFSDSYPAPYAGHGSHVKMFSVTKETYEFYMSIIEQFDSDGGTYSPTPSLYKGNITGGAIGIFRAVEESIGEVVIPYS